MRQQSPESMSLQKAWSQGQKCSHEGCTNQVVQGGICVRHGVTWTKRICSHEGSTNNVKKGDGMKERDPLKYAAMKDTTICR
mmetsp:Transcript_8884/g.16273  ORF Transcript_8884/g.16273 Transcript_8884/m.16273 type:complete len:82 (+) Transcript_8884:380-625(+)